MVISSHYSYLGFYQCFMGDGKLAELDLAWLDQLKRLSLHMFGILGLLSVVFYSQCFKINMID